ncbi:MAG: hypothetical protein KME31_11660 [Tolypothrix carrinoi HA7290-LM1]|nr:hypothetical protein [Tolypothrix carrinoi HA7290-LM1]
MQSVTFIIPRAIVSEEAGGRGAFLQGDKGDKGDKGSQCVRSKDLKHLAWTRETSRQGGRGHFALCILEFVSPSPHLPISPSPHLPISPSPPLPIPPSPHPPISPSPHLPIPPSPHPPLSPSPHPPSPSPLSPLGFADFKFFI